MVKLMFQKAANGTWFDKLVGWWTNGPYSHVEILFSKNECFSSSPRDGGCRFKIIPPDDHWDVVWLHGIDEDLVKRKCMYIAGKKYDWFSTFFNFMIPFDKYDPKRYTCSEVVVKEVFNFRKAFKYSPNDLFKLINIFHL